MASIDNNFTFAEATFPFFFEDDLAAITGMKKRVDGMACESGAVVGRSVGRDSAVEGEYELSGSFGGFGCGRRPTAVVGLGERVAARAGFSAPRLNTARIRLGGGAFASPRGARSPCLTIPPGLSPTTLLDSPVFLFNSQAQPSPTTGAFPFPPLSQRNDSTIPDTTTVPAAASKEQQTCELYSDSIFAFKPHVGGHAFCFHSSGDQASFSIQEPSWSRVEDAFQPKYFVKAKNTVSVQLVSETHTKGQHQNESYDEADSLSISSGESNIKNTTSDKQASIGIMCSEQSPLTEDQLDDNGDKVSSFSPAAVGASSDDGYNWRKYGQKQVKSSEYPRSYYKCTHTNCPVRKKIERAHDGHITEIIYKGAHNHPKPPPGRRSLAALPAIETAALERQDQGLHENAESQPVWRINQLETSAGNQNWKADSSEMISLAPSADFCGQSISAQSRSLGHHEMTDATEISSTLSGGNEDDEMATNFSTPLGDEGEVDELESKRRKKDDGCTVDAAMTSRGIREPRVVVQTTSEVDILDDGYRWRKYGQKVVKGNPNPRSYYKCTSPGCPVRKHVERASHDLKSVITTYEGKHNHDVPAARNSTGGNHLTSATSSMGTAPASSSHILKPEPVPPQNIMRISNLHEQLSMSSLPRIGPANTPQIGQPLYSGLSSFPLNQQMGLGSFKFSGLPGGHEKLAVGPYLVQHKLAEVAPPSRLPGELTEEPVFDSGVPGMHGSLYHQIMGTLPLGPQL